MNQSTWPPTEPLEDMGYHEFACSPETARFLVSGGMQRVNDEPVTLQHVETLRDGRWLMRVWSKSRQEHAPGTYGWQT